MGRRSPPVSQRPLVKYGGYTYATGKVRREKGGGRHVWLLGTVVMWQPYVIGWLGCWGAKALSGTLVLHPLTTGQGVAAAIRLCQNPTSYDVVFSTCVVDLDGVVERKALSGDPCEIPRRMAWHLLAHVVVLTRPKVAWEGTIWGRWCRQHIV